MDSRQAATCDSREEYLGDEVMTLPAWYDGERQYDGAWAEEVLPKLQAGETFVTGFWLDSCPDDLAGAEVRRIMGTHRTGERTGYLTDQHTWGWLLWLPACGRVAVLFNGDPSWYDAGSLEEAWAIYLSGEYA